MKANEEHLPWSNLVDRLNILEAALSANDVSLIRKIMQDLVPGYQPSGEIVDWVHLENETNIGVA